MMRSYLAAWGDREAYAVSHVGFGMNPLARYEALAMYDKRDTNGNRNPRARSATSCFSTGANEFAGRYTAGHFDLPVMRTTITVERHGGRARRRLAGRVSVSWLRLCHADPPRCQALIFPGHFRAFLATKREAAADVEQTVRGIIADVQARGDRASSR